MAVLTFDWKCHLILKNKKFTSKFQIRNSRWYRALLGRPYIWVKMYLILKNKKFTSKFQIRNSRWYRALLGRAPNFARPHSIATLDLNSPSSATFGQNVPGMDQFGKKNVLVIFGKDIILFCWEIVGLCGVAFACLIFPTQRDWFQSAREYQRCGGRETRIMENDEPPIQILLACWKKEELPIWI